MIDNRKNIYADDKEFSLKEHRYKRLLLTLSEMASEPSPDGSFQISRLQPLKTLFSDLDAYREFVLMILTEVQADVEKSGYSPLVPIEDKIQVFDRVRQVVVGNSDSGVEKLKQIGEELYNLQPGWKRVWAHSSRRRGRDRQLLLLEHAANSFFSFRGYFGFQMVCMYLVAVDDGWFRFSPDASAKLLRIRDFWNSHPPQFTSAHVRPQKPTTPALLLSSQSIEEIDSETQEKTSYQPGDWVMHKTFGCGMVLKAEKTNWVILTIGFEYCGVKRIMTRFAPMWPIPKPDLAELRRSELSAPQLFENSMLGRRYLKSFASGIAHMFASSANHYAWLAHHFGSARVTINLLALEIEPAEFDIKRNRILAGMCRYSLLRSVKRLKPPAVVTSARLIAEFDIHDYTTEQRGSEYIGKSLFTVVLTDDRGHEWSVTNIAERMLAQGDGFGDPNR